MGEFALPSAAEVRRTHVPSRYADAKIEFSTRRRVEHRSSSVIASVALAASALFATYLAVEGGLALAGLPPLLMRPFTPPLSAGAAAIVAVAAALALTLASVVCLVSAVSPARLSRRDVGEASPAAEASAGVSESRAEAFARARARGLLSAPIPAVPRSTHTRTVSARADAVH